ncbi:MAG: VWA domain-containing protein [Marinilabiliaceae bacterium]|jgi:Ca-activated chloride channel family protein|nr:VWA domain-containing protein [Marinilabiliaceae bacterium]
MSRIDFASPLSLWLLALVPLMIALYLFRQRNVSASVRLSSLQFKDSLGLSWRVVLRHILFAFRVLAVIFIIIVLARPQSSDRWQDSTTEGIDIIMAMDISGSMLARDFKPDRLEASKNVATEFISGRPYDRIGLVIFSGESFTQCPLTSDHAVLINLMREMESGMIEDGTAIGLGLATAVNRIKDSEAVSKVIILLTDGVNNRGSIAPLTAAEIASTMGIRVYTVGVGTRGVAPYPVQTAAGTRYQNMPVEIDEDVLREIASMTDGKYFRATNNESLIEIYKEIDKLEKSRIDVQEYNVKNEEYLPWAMAALLMIFIELILGKSLLRRYV